MEKKSKSTNLQPDKLFATYYWVMKLDHDHQDNYNPNVKEMTGYSKFQGQDEPKDKNHLLMRKIVMLTSRGYLSKTHSIEFYKRMGSVLDKSKARQILTLYRDDYQLEGDKLILAAQTDLIQFLNKVYDALRTGKPVDHILPKADTNFSKDDYLNVEKQNFKSRSQLYAYCERLIKSGHNFAAIQHFSFSYLQQKPF